MALNFLLRRHQDSLVSASAGITPEARAAHRALAAGYARRIADLQAQAGFGEASENPDRILS